MKDIIIVCAGGFGQEVFYMIKDINDYEISQGRLPKYNIIGFINDIPDALEGTAIDSKIIGTIQEWNPTSKEVYALGISTPKSKEKIVKHLKNKGANFETIIVPGTKIYPGTSYGEGCIISPYCLGADVKLGNFVNIMGSAIGQGAEIGDYSTTTAFSNTTNAIIGKRVFIGSMAVITNKRKIGDDAFVGAGSIVVRDVKPNTKVFGNPAKRLDL